MAGWRGSYTTYSIGVALVWALTLGGVAVWDHPHLHTMLLVFGGWAIGWVSGTIARHVYRPPKRWQRG